MCDLGHALPVRRSHPRAVISLDELAVTTNRTAPSRPLVVKVDGMEWRHLSWQRGPELVRVIATWIDLPVSKWRIKLKPTVLA